LALILGTRLGVYEVTAQIGEGGMGQVYRATDTRLKRQVAILNSQVLLASFRQLTAPLLEPRDGFSKWAVSRSERVGNHKELRNVQTDNCRDSPNVCCVVRGCKRE
jgi:serine/threonine protein kinase